MTFSIDLQNDNHYADLPNEAEIETWLTTALKYIPPSEQTNKTAIAIRFIDKTESTFLNETYRHKKGPTNILSFPDENIPGFESDSLGDLAICEPLVIEEACAQNKTTRDHLTHLIIHGYLHLLGYDHEIDQEAEVMEQLEIQILQALNIKNPY